jgi:hypothetical protein
MPQGGAPCVGAHAADVDVRGGRIVVAETGETRASTTTGSVRAFEVR